MKKEKFTCFIELGRIVMVSYIEVSNFNLFYFDLCYFVCFSILWTLISCLTYIFDAQPVLSLCEVYLGGGIWRFWVYRQTRKPQALQEVLRTEIFGNILSRHNKNMASSDAWQISLQCLPSNTDAVSCPMVSGVPAIYGTLPKLSWFQAQVCPAHMKHWSIGWCEILLRHTDAKEIGLCRLGNDLFHLSSYFTIGAQNHQRYCATPLGCGWISNGLHSTAFWLVLCFLW